MFLKTVYLCSKAALPPEFRRHSKLVSGITSTRQLLTGFIINQSQLASGISQADGQPNSGNHKVPQAEGFCNGLGFRVELRIAVRSPICRPLNSQLIYLIFFLLTPFSKSCHFKESQQLRIGFHRFMPISEDLCLEKRLFRVQTCRNEKHAVNLHSQISAMVP